MGDFVNELSALFELPMNRFLTVHYMKEISLNTFN